MQYARIRVQAILKKGLAKGVQGEPSAVTHPGWPRVPALQALKLMWPEAAVIVLLVYSELESHPNINEAVYKTCTQILACLQLLKLHPNH